MNSKKRFETKEQQLHRIQEGISFGDGEEYCARDYLNMAIHESREWLKKHYSSKTSNCRYSKDDNWRSRMTPGNLESDYWDIVETHADTVEVEYGNDVDSSKFGSGFPRSERGRCVDGEVDVDKFDLPEPKFGTEDFYKETYWNLCNIPCCDESILRHVKVGINGINVPWLYFGNLFSTFCWHNEDNYLYSINYHHWGAPKQWYGVPGNAKDAEGLESVFKNCLSVKMRDSPDLLHHITTMFSPRLLQQGNVPVNKILQYPGEFIVTFPRAYHSGFSMGPNIGEAVNFASNDWVTHGGEANEKYRSFARPSVFSHDRLAFTMANHLEDQKDGESCRLLLQELRRAIEEERRLRAKLLKSGVRDISNEVKLPKNRLDRLDEECMEYDDKRLCHACKHICFYSCVACECSHSKVSCLRHVHYMCRCSMARKYMMVWVSDEEMKQTEKTVEQFYEILKSKENQSNGSEKKVDETNSDSENKMMNKTDDAPGSVRNYETYKGYEIDLSELSPLCSLPSKGEKVLQKFRQYVEKCNKQCLDAEKSPLKRRKVDEKLQTRSDMSLKV